MALVVADRVKETTTSVGTSTINLAGAEDNFESFVTGVGSGNTTYYAIVDKGNSEFEVGIGTVTSGTPDTLSRDTVLASSNSDALVNFTSGTKDVFCTQPAEKAVYLDSSGQLVIDGTAVTATAAELNYVDGVTSNIQTQLDSKLNLSGGTMTGALTLSGAPTADNHATTKVYVDELIAAGIHYHDPVRVESPDSAGNLSATYDNGTSGVGATLTNNGTQAALVIDGVTLNTNDRVLIYNQTNAFENGIYTVTNTGSASTNWVLTRATDADSYGIDNQSLSEGTSVFVLEGDDGSGEVYACTTTGTITFGTTAINFSQIGRSAVITGNGGITVTGNEVSANVDATVQTTAANSVTSTASRTYAVQVDSNNDLVVNVPWVDTDTDTDTTYTAGTGLTLSGTQFNVDDDYVLNTGDAIAGQLSITDSAWPPLEVTRDAGSVTTGNYGSLKLNTSTTGTPADGLGSYAAFYVDDVIKGSIGFENDGSFHLTDGGSTEHLVVDGSSNVGIGTTSPRENLSIVNTNIADNGSQAFLRHNQYWNGSAISVENSSYGTSQIGLNRSGGGHLTFETGGVNTAATEKMRITSGGDVGIGTSSPSGNLQVRNTDTTGSIRLGGGNGAGNHRLYFQADATNAYIDSYGDNAYDSLAIEASPLKLNVSSGGAITTGSGTFTFDGGSTSSYGPVVTSTSTAGPAIKLDANGTSGKELWLISNASANADGGGRIQFWNSTDSRTFATLAANAGERTKLYNPVEITHTNLSAEPYSGLHIKNTNAATGAAYTGLYIDAQLQSHVRLATAGSLKWQMRTGTTTSGDLRFYSWDGSADVLTVTSGGDATFTGTVTANGPDGGMLIGEYAPSAAYGSIRTGNMGNNEYILLTDGTDTFISGGSNGEVYVRGGGNDSSPQMRMSTTQARFEVAGGDTSQWMLNGTSNWTYMQITAPSGYDTGIIFSEGTNNGTDRRAMIGFDQSEDALRIYWYNNTSGTAISTDRVRFYSTGATTFTGDVTDVLNFTANSTNDNRGISFNSRTALSADYNDNWLRLNNANEFANGVYTPLNFRADGDIFAYSQLVAGRTSLPTGGGQISLDGSGNGSPSSSPYISWHESGTRRAYMQYNIGSNFLFIYNEEAGDIRLRGNSTSAYTYFQNSAGNGGRLFVNGQDFAMSHDNGEHIVYGRENENTWLYYNGNWKLRTQVNGIDIRNEANTYSEIRMTTGSAADTRGYVYCNTSNNIGFLDQGGNWAIRHINDQGTYFYTDNSTVNARIGGDLVTGNYGTIQTDTYKSGWSGYSITGNWVFMGNGSSNCGIYNDTDNEWMAYFTRNAEARLYHNGAEKIRTDSSGLLVNTTSASYTSNDNTPVVGSTTNNVLHVNGSIQLNSNNDAIVFGRGTASFMKDEEIGFGWGGGWYMTDGTYLRVRGNKHLYSTGDASFDQMNLSGKLVGSGLNLSPNFDLNNSGGLNISDVVEYLKIQAGTDTTYVESGMVLDMPWTGVASTNSRFGMSVIEGGVTDASRVNTGQSALHGDTWLLGNIKHGTGSVAAIDEGIVCAPGDEIRIESSGDIVLSADGSVTGGGKIQNIWTTVASSTWSGGGNGTTWYTVTPMVRTAGMSSDTSKFLIFINAHMGSQYWELQLRLKATIDGSDYYINIGDARGSRPRVTGSFNIYGGSTTNGQYQIAPLSLMCFDTAAPVLGYAGATVTYQLEANGYSSNAIYLNRTHQDYNNSDYYATPSSTMIVMEY